MPPVKRAATIQHAASTTTSARQKIHTSTTPTLYGSQTAIANHSPNDPVSLHLENCYDIVYLMFLFI